MVRKRVIETDEGITGEATTLAYDRMQRRLRDRGWLETDGIIGAGIDAGVALEVGSGPGYLGLEWLKRTRDTRLKGLDISEDMLVIARRNAVEYGLEDRVEYHWGDACRMPFEDGSFDAVFSNGSLHEWAHPEEIFNEIVRVLKPGGRYAISDMRRDMPVPVKWFLRAFMLTSSKPMRHGLVTSINAAYIRSEIEALLCRTNLRGWRVDQNLIGLNITGRQE